jgi:hypothetical protein
MLVQFKFVALAVSFGKFLIETFCGLSEQQRAIVALQGKIADLQTEKQEARDRSVQRTYVIAYLLLIMGLDALGVLPHKAYLGLYAVSVAASFLVCSDDFRTPASKVAFRLYNRLLVIEREISGRSDHSNPELIRKPGSGKPSTKDNIPRAA